MEIPIPGYSSSSGINTKELIDKLVEAERAPIKRIDQNIENAAQEADVWADLGASMSNFQRYAKKLYGFENPFADRSVVVSDESVLTAQATRGAAAGEYEIEVLQAAKADAWMSESFRKDQNLSAGTYTFVSGPDTVSVAFGGGTLARFVDEFNRAAGENVMRMRLVQKGTSVNETSVVLDGLRSGKKYAMLLKDQAVNLANLLGWNAAGGEAQSAHELPLASSSVAQVLSDRSLVASDNNVITSLSPGAIVRFKFSDTVPPDIALASDAALTFVVRAVNAPAAVNSAVAPTNSAAAGQPAAANAAAQPAANTSAAAQSAGASAPQQNPANSAQQAAAANTTSGASSTQTQNQTQAAAAQTQTADQTIDEAIGARIEDVSVLGVALPADLSDAAGEKGVLFSADNSEALYALAADAVASGASVTLSVPFSKVAKDGLVSFTVTNPFVQYSLILERASITASAGREEIKKYEISKAQNAIVRVNGVDMERESNVIDGLLPGVTLTVKRASDKPVSLAVQSSSNSAKDDIVNFVGAYNNLMKKITVYTSPPADAENSVLNDLEFASEQERAAAEANLGTLSGDFSLIRLVNSMVTGMTRQYIGAPDRQYNMLRSIGIGSNISTAGAGGAITNRFMDIDESRLDAALADNFSAVASLFGFDSNGDIAVDDGVAFYTASLVEPFVSSTGIAKQKQTSIRSTIAREQQQRARYEQRVEAYRQKITRDFASMEGSLGRLEETTKTLQQFSNQGQQ